MFVWAFLAAVHLLRFPGLRNSRFGAFVLMFCWAGGAAAGRPAQSVSPDAPPLTEQAAKALKSPIPNSAKSITRGKVAYGLYGCANCHGQDGKALIEVVANATDLTDPKIWKNGVEEGLIYRSVRDGAGLAMPPYKMEVTAQEDLWHLVNFIRSLWPEGQRPPVVADK
jgi:mono/diheme cytochrome c family protein